MQENKRIDPKTLKGEKDITFHLCLRDGMEHRECDFCTRTPGGNNDKSIIRKPLQTDI